MFTIREYEKKDRENVAAVTLELEKYYPGIKNWLYRPGGELDKLDAGKDFCLVVEADSTIVGVSISSLVESPAKNDAVKLKTFYLIEEFQHLAVGNSLLELTMDHWAKKHVKKMYVTMSGEEFPKLRRYFEKYGFMFGGVSPNLYRDKSLEYFMNKEMRYGKVNLADHIQFVLDNLFKAYGFEITKVSDDLFVATKRDFFSIPVRCLVSFSENISKDHAERILSGASAQGCNFSFVISQKPAEHDLLAAYGEKIAFVDFLYLETLFYPLVFEHNEDAGFIQPIQTRYSELLFFEPKQPLLVVPPKAKLRSDKVYYRSAKSAERIKRGQAFVIYESEPTSAIIGEGRVKGVEVDSAKNLFEKYGGQGVLKLPELEARADEHGNLMAISFSRTVRYPKKVRVEDVGLSVPQTLGFLDDAQLTKIRELGGYFE